MLQIGPSCDNSHSLTKSFRELMFLPIKAFGLGITNMVLGLSEVNCLLLQERLKSGENYTKNQPLRTPEGLISRTQLKKGFLS